MFEYLRWKHREYKRLVRLMRPEDSERLLIDTIGAFWLWRHGARREFRVSLWKGRGWYAIDLALPHRMTGIEAKGGWRHYYGQRDVARDQELRDKGWQIVRVTEQELKQAPRAQRRRLRKFLKG